LNLNRLHWWGWQVQSPLKHNQEHIRLLRPDVISPLMAKNGTVRDTRGDFYYVTVCQGLRESVSRFTCNHLSEVVSTAAENGIQHWSATG